MHYGHVEFLKKCSELGDVIVGVNSDDFIESFKPAPTMTAEERMHGIGLLGYTTILNTSNGRELIETVKPDILAIGSDWARKDYLKQIDVTQDWLDENHISLIYIPYKQTFSISSTEIKRRIRENDPNRTTLA